MATPAHISVLYAETLAALSPRAGGRYIDGTLGWGGHSAGILEATAPDGHVLGIDQDTNALQAAQQRLAPFGDRFQAAHGNYRTLDTIAVQHGWPAVDGVLLDIGVSSPQLDTAQRGFSFQHDAPLDMRMNPDGSTTAADLINELPEDELADVIYGYGEERLSRRIARRIVEQRKHHAITRTLELAEIVARAVGGKRGPIHPATRTFQALRIAVNDELGALKEGLAAAARVLKPKGRLVVITFHSLEDRIVKEWMRDEASECLLPPKIEIGACPHLLAPNHIGPRPCIYPTGRACNYAPRLELVTKKPITASAEELARNPRARSAKLRAAERR